MRRALSGALAVIVELGFAAAAQADIPAQSPSERVPGTVGIVVAIVAVTSLLIVLLVLRRRRKLRERQERA